MAVIYNEKNRIFALQGKHSEYLFCLHSNGLLKHLYWGEKTNAIDDFEEGWTITLSAHDVAPDIVPEEYSPLGGLRFKETSLKAEFSDGTRDVKPVYDGHDISGETLKINLKDEHYPLKVDLSYRLYEDLDIIERWTEVTNTGKEPVRLESIASGEFNFDRDGFSHTNVHGHWGAEHQLFREPLTWGKKVLESRRGDTGHNHSPYFILDQGANEEAGDVYFGVLGYSGSFKTVLEVTPYRTTRAVIGINDFDFAWNLKGGETFTTPPVYCGHTREGFTGMSRNLHALGRHHILPANHRDEIRPVLYNSWEATWFDVTVEGQSTLAEKAAAMGVELFVLDDGWFGARNDDNAGLGDWYINKEKFPDGLTPLIDRVNELGMDFGIWVELEMVNPDSDLYRAHPDWVYRFENREPSLARNQLVLNLCNPEVVDYLKKVMRDLLSENNITFIKWDFNRPFSEPGALTLPREERQSIWYRHTLAMYDIADTIRKEFSRVTIEACASGGGRVDFGCLAHYDQYWTSDNTDALDRLTIQEGYGYVYPVKAMRAWVTDCPNFFNKRDIPLKYRFLCAMAGTLGIGGDLNQWQPDSLDEAKGLVALYREIRHIVQEGVLYRIRSIQSGICVFQYVLDEKESVLFAFNRGEQFGKELFPVTMRGLDPDRRYRVNIEGHELEKSGSFLMKAGLTLHLPGDYACKLLRVDAVDCEQQKRL